MTAYTLHDEVPLHSYPRRIMPLMRQLREQEERARANISEFDPSTFDKNDAAEELQFRFTTNASLIGDLYLVYIREALTAHEKETLTAEENELSPKVGDGGNRKGGISWGCLTPPLLHRRSDMPCPTITSSI
ncbi:hypothetical protein ACVWXM_002018 [Bradyrhizobium sp. GM7.3]